MLSEFQMNSDYFNKMLQMTDALVGFMGLQDQQAYKLTSQSQKISKQNPMKKVTGSINLFSGFSFALRMKPGKRSFTL